MLEADGIRLLNNSEMEDDGDLRKSIGSGSNKLLGEAGQHLHEKLVLLKELEKVKQERDDFKRGKEQLQRDILN